METKWTPGPWSLKIRSGTGESTANEVIAEIEQAEPEGGYRGDIARLQSAKHIGGIADEELVANAHLLFAAPDLHDGGQAQTAIICRAQAILTQYLIPDGIDGPEAINQLLGLLDGPDQRAAQAKWDAALAKARGQA